MSMYHGNRHMGYFNPLYGVTGIHVTTRKETNEARARLREEAERIMSAAPVTVPVSRVVEEKPFNALADALGACMKVGGPAPLQVAAAIGELSDREMERVEANT